MSAQLKELGKAPDTRQRVFNSSRIVEAGGVPNHHVIIVREDERAATLAEGKPGAYVEFGR